MTLVGGCRTERNKGEKKWDNCNNILNKMYFKKSINIYVRIFYINFLMYDFCSQINDPKVNSCLFQLAVTNFTDSLQKILGASLER